MNVSAFQNLARRHRVPELMDQPGLDAREHARALRGLRRINVLSRSSAILWPAIARLARDRPGPPIRVLDLASGGGDVAIGLARRAARARLNVQVVGCDISSQAIDHARRQAEARDLDVRFFPCDVLHEPLPDGYDVLTCSLFLHHLDEDDAVALLRRMATAARRTVRVNDLVRSRPGYWLAWLGCRVLSRSRIVRYDGPASVAGAFTPREALSLATRAGLAGATVTRHWPQRYLLAWSR